MIARYIMNQRVISVGPDVSAEEATSLLVQHGISGMPVVDDNEQVIGVVSATDCIARKGLYVRDLMTSPAVCVDADCSIQEVAALLAAKDITRVPVVENGKLVGIISRTDIVRYVATKRAWDEARQS